MAFVRRTSGTRANVGQGQKGSYVKELPGPKKTTRPTIQKLLKGMIASKYGAPRGQQKRPEEEMIQKGASLEAQVVGSPDFSGRGQAQGRMEPSSEFKARQRALNRIINRTVNRSGQMR